MAEPTTVDALINVGERVLRDSTYIFEDHDNRREAEELMAHCMDAKIDEVDSSLRLPRRTRERFLSLVARRAAGEPFPLLVGSIDFYGLQLPVRSGSFIPRPSSELTVDRAVRVLRRRSHPIVVDVCTGGGPIALAIADEVPEAEVWGTDIDAGGLAQGRQNAKLLDVPNVIFRKGDMYSALPRRLRGSVDVIAGHIPYVPPDEIDELPAEVREHEPLFTLTDQSDDGLGLIRRAVEEAPTWLKRGGWLLLEISDDLAGNVKRMCRRAGFSKPVVASDEDELSVVVECRWPRRRL
jgi:release factor glutamine methyltransferase